MADGRFRLIDLIDDMCEGKDVFFRSVRSAGDVMTSDVRTLRLDDTLQTCLAFMEENKVRHVPVADRPTGEEDKPCLMGIVSQRDVLRQVSPYVGKLGQEDADARALRQPLQDILTRSPKSVLPQTPLPDVLATMVEDHVDVVTVLSDGDLVGIVTAGDIVKLFVRLDAVRRVCADAGKTARLVDVVSAGPGGAADVFSAVLRTVQDIMTEDVVCLSPEDTLAQAVEVMQNRQVRHVPIVDAEGRLGGIVSDRDVLRNLPFAPRRRASRDEGFRGRLFAVDREDKSLRLLLRRVMTRKVVHILPDSTVYDAAKTLHKMGVSCLPVVDEQKVLRGIVTVTDLMRALLAAYRLTESPHLSTTA